jgi:sulfatase maturation enzyme AslB (radical SAM superfamily)
VDLPQVAERHPNRELRDLPQPAPSAGLDAYRRELELALQSDPRKAENYQRYMASNRRHAEVDYLPIKLDIENVSRCNFKCVMCVVSDWPKGQRGADMSLDDFKRIIDEQYGLVEIKLQGIGEPTLQGDAYFQMIAYARSKHIWVRTTTNASLLHLKDNWRKLADARPNEIQISIDGATKEVFEAIRRGSVFEQVKQNCAKLNAHLTGDGRRITKMWTVVQQGNRHQLHELVDLAAELGFRDQAFAFSLANWGADAWREKNDAVTVEDQLSADLAWSLVEHGKCLGIAVSFWNSTDKYRTDKVESLCAWPFERAVITSDLKTVPCCTIGNPESFEIGRDSGKGFSELWFSDEFKAFRQAHLSGNPPAVCRTCYTDDKKPAASGPGPAARAAE